MGCSGSKAADPCDVIVDVGERLAGLDEYKSSVDNRGSAVTAGLVRQVQLPLPNSRPISNPTHSPIVP